MGKSVGPVIPYKSYKRAAIEKAISKRFHVGFDALYEEFIEMTKKLPSQRDETLIERAKRIRLIIENSKECLRYREIAGELIYQNKIKQQDELQPEVKNYQGKETKITSYSVRDCIRKTQMLGRRSRRAFIEAIVKLFPEFRR